MIGIEMCQEAVEDAKVNAKLNGRHHKHHHFYLFVAFSLGKAHKLWY